MKNDYNFYKYKICINMYSIHDNDDDIILNMYIKYEWHHFNKLIV